MRYWNNKVQDDGSIHSIGNGHICAYEQGPDIIQIFGSPYSLPAIMSIALTGEKLMETKSTRQQGTSIWCHELSIEGLAVGTMTDFTYVNKPCFIRKITLTSEITFVLNIEKENISVVQNEKSLDGVETSGAMLLTANAGTFFYADLYASQYKGFYQIAVKGNVSIIKSENDPRKYLIKFGIGESLLTICGGINYPECVGICKDILTNNVDELLENTRKACIEFGSKQKDFKSLISDEFFDKQNLLNAIDSVSTLINCQTDVHGAILAGHNYHLAYVRDQFGVVKCLLDLGRYDQVKKNLLYYYNIWATYKTIRNAQTLGFHGIFHIHENDDVEITGYLIIQSFYYYQQTSDHDLLKQILPMLKWALTSQLKHLAHFMLPFNGDETYVAGGLLPRTALNDGSAEATLLLLESAKLLLNYTEANDTWDKQEEYSKIVEEVKKHYNENFFINGNLITNNPKRKDGLLLPQFRHGVCEGCHAFGWSKKNANDRYLCASCFEVKDVPKTDDKVYALLSVGLVPVFIGSDILTRDEIESVVLEIMESYGKTGKLPSSRANLNVGYDYGLLLNALTYLKHPSAKKIYGKMMSLIDQTGSWVEYYDNEKPCSTRCRPWESAINLSAAINYALNFKDCE